MNRPLRICMVTTFYPPYNFGGDGIYVHRLSNELARRGHHIEVIHSIDAYRLKNRPATGSYNDHPNIIVHGLASPFSMLTSLTTQQTGIPFFHLRRIREILSQPFDVIHYHNISLVGGPQILTYGQGAKLYSTHEYWLVCPTHILFRYNRAACTKPHCFLCSLMYARPPQWWRYTHFLRNASQHVDAFIAPSRFTIDIHHRFGFDLPFVQLPYFAPSIELAPKMPESRAKQKPYFLFVGRLEKLKGVHTLIPIFRECPNAKLLIAGAGGQERELRKLADKNPNIEFLGRLTEEQLQPLYRHAVAVIIPSLAYESFGLVALEAFRQQTPVIVRNLGALPELVEQSHGGMIYDRDEQLVAAMGQLLANPSLRNDLGMHGYETYQKKWTSDLHLKRYFELIYKIQQSKQLVQ